MMDEQNVDVNLEITIRDIAPFVRVVECACEILRQADSLGFVSGDSPELAEMERAIVCLSPELGKDGVL